MNVYDGVNKRAKFNETEMVRVRLQKWFYSVIDYKRMFGFVLFWLWHTQTHTHTSSHFNCLISFFQTENASTYGIVVWGVVAHIVIVAEKWFNSSISLYFFFSHADCFRLPQFISLKLLFSLFVTSNESRPVFSCYVKHLPTVVLHYDWNWHFAWFFFLLLFLTLPFWFGSLAWQMFFFSCFLFIFDGMTWKQFRTNNVAVRIVFNHFKIYTGRNFFISIKKNSAVKWYNQCCASEKTKKKMHQKFNKIYWCKAFLSASTVKCPKAWDFFSLFNCCSKFT